MTETCDSCGDEGRICRDCGFCAECAARSIREDEGLCPTCVFDAATYGILRMLALEADQ